jgi:hypothetical protein
MAGKFSLLEIGSSDAVRKGAVLCSTNVPWQSISQWSFWLKSLLSIPYREEDPCHAREHRVIALKLHA